MIFIKKLEEKYEKIAPPKSDFKRRQKRRAVQSIELMKSHFLIDVFLFQKKKKKMKKRGKKIRKSSQHFVG